MNTRLIRWIDKYLGNVLVFILSLFCPPVRSKITKSFKTIVIGKYFGLGSILMATPLLQLLKSMNPQARLSIVTFKRNEPLIRLLPFIDDTILIDDRSFSKLAGSSIAAIIALRRYKIDVFFDLEFFSRYSAMMTFMSGAMTRVGFSVSGNPRKNLLTHALEIAYPKSILSAFLSQAAAAELVPWDQLDMIDCNIYQLINSLPNESFIRSKELLKSLKIDDFMVFNATGGEAIGEEREWPDENWAMLAELVVKETGLHVIFSGDNSSLKQVEHILDLCHNLKIHNLAGITTFYDFIAMIRMARSVVTIDSAALHIAQSVGTPTVTLYGPEPPVVSAYSELRNRTVYKGFNGAPCPCFDFYENKEVKCRHGNQCMKAISVNEVLEALKDVLLISDTGVPTNAETGEAQRL